MAKENKTGGQKQTNQKKTAKKSAPQSMAKKEAPSRPAVKTMPKLAPKPAPKPAAKPEPSFSMPKYQVVKPADPAAQPLLSSPPGIALLAAGAIMFFAGVYFLAKIQYTASGSGGFIKGCALLALGVIAPCAGVKQIREFLFPRKTADQYGLSRPGEKKN